MTNHIVHLTRQAAEALRDIHARSLKQWGQILADGYLAELYAVFQKAAVKPELGELCNKTMPFLMLPFGQHFVIYGAVPEGIVVLSLLQQRRDIELLVADLEPDFLMQIKALWACKALP